MQQTFDPIEYVNSVGEDLVTAFDRAGEATTPGLVGGARETSARNKLEQLLPPGIGVGSGCVIDSYGETSRQIDVVIYEKHISPVYSINEDSEARYYPCEGVIAVGEIKSLLNSRELRDIFDKIESVKALKRFSIQREMMGLRDELSVPYRNYGTTATMWQRRLGVPDYSQTDYPLDQIFGFALAGTLDLNPETLCKKFIEHAMEFGALSSPNLIVSLDKGVLCPNTPSDKLDGVGELHVSLEDGSGICHVDRKHENFRYLVSMIYRIYHEGRTVPISAFERYIDPQGALTLLGDGIYVPFEGNSSETD